MGVINNQNVPCQKKGKRLLFIGFISTVFSLCRDKTRWDTFPRFNKPPQFAITEA